MKKSPLKRVMALTGVIVILTLFLLTIVFLLMGNTSLAVTFVAINGFVTVVLYFVLRFHQSIVDENPDITDAGSDNEEK